MPEMMFASDFFTNETYSEVYVTSVTPNDGENLSVRDFSVGYGERGHFLGGSTPDEYSLSGSHTLNPDCKGASK